MILIYCCLEAMRGRSKSGVLLHEALRFRITCSLETSPETKLYQVLGYIEFLESQYAHRTLEEDPGLQKLAERLEAGLSNRTMSPS